MARNLLWLAVLGAGLYIGWQYGAPYFRAWRFRDAITQTARLSSATSDAEMRSSLQEAALEFGIPLKPRRLHVSRDRRGTHIMAAWEEVVTIDAWKLGTWVDTLDFGYDQTVRRDEDAR